MEIETFSSVIGSVGFPIVVCWFMWRYINTVMREFNATIEANTRILKQIFKILTEREEREKGRGSHE